MKFIFTYILVIFSFAFAKAEGLQSGCFLINNLAGYNYHFNAICVETPNSSDRPYIVYLGSVVAGSAERFSLIESTQKVKFLETSRSFQPGNEMIELGQPWVFGDQKFSAFLLDREITQFGFKMRSTNLSSSEAEGALEISFIYEKGSASKMTSSTNKLIRTNNFCLYSQQGSTYQRIIGTCPF